jgi:hypothetical protein
VHAAFAVKSVAKSTVLRDGSRVYWAMFRSPRTDRIAVLAIVVLCVCAGWAGGCSHDRDAESTARLFLDRYLVAADQRSALELTSGRAHAEIQKEIDLLSSFEGRDEALKQVQPEVKYTKLEERSRANGEVSLLYSVSVKRPGVDLPAQEIFLHLAREGDVYKVKSFSFRAPSDSRTSGTP